MDTGHFETFSGDRRLVSILLIGLSLPMIVDYLWMIHGPVVMAGVVTGL